MSKKRKRWTEEDILFLKNNYGVLTYKEMSEYLQWSVGGIRNKAVELGIISKTSRKWSKEEESILIENYHKMSIEDLVLLFKDRSEKSINGKAEKMKLKKSGNRRMIYWEEKEIGILKRYYQTEDEEFFKNTLPAKSWVQIQQKASRMGINKYKMTSSNRREKKVWNSEQEIVEYISSKNHTVKKIYFKNGSRHIDFLDEFGSHRTMEMTIYFKYDGELPTYKHHYEFALKTIKENGYELLTKKDQYTSGETPLDLLCPRNHKWTCDFTRFKNGVRCKTCFHENSGRNSWITEEDILSNLKNMSFRDISIRRYEGTQSEVKYICSNHEENGMQVEAYQKIISRKYGCYQCGIDKRSGEKHPFWKDGITDLTKWMRGRIKPWIEDSLREGNNMCKLSGTHEEIVVHHKYAFKKIMNETMCEINLDVREDIGKYSKEELLLIKEKALALHYEYGLGVCLNKDIHKLFHEIYSYHKFTEENFEEFKLRYKSGEFTELLNERRLDICEQEKE